MNELWPISPFLSTYNLICILPYLTQNEETRRNMQKPPKNSRNKDYIYIPNGNHARDEIMMDHD